MTDKQAITSRHNPLFKELNRARKDRSLLFLEGHRLVSDARGRGLRAIMTAVTSDYAVQHGLPPQAVVLAEALLRSLAATTNPQGIVAFFEAPWAPRAAIAAAERLIVLDGLQDPGNVGTIVRSAEAFGFPLVVMAGSGASPFCDKAVRASMGSCLGVAIARVDSVAELVAGGHHIVCLDPRGAVPLAQYAFEGRLALCFGQEAAGVSPELLALAGDRLAIPMPGGAESLNVAVAAGIVMARAAGVV